MKKTNKKGHGDGNEEKNKEVEPPGHGDRNEEKNKEGESRAKTKKDQVDKLKSRKMFEPSSYSRNSP
jgi:hypothetical protein